MRALIMTIGSTGDVFPFIRIGAALRDAGHAVTYLCMPLFREAIETAGLEFVPIPPDWSRDEVAATVRELMNLGGIAREAEFLWKRTVPFFDAHIRTLDRELPGADVLITNHLCSHYRYFANRRSIPLVKVIWAGLPTLEAPPLPLPPFLPAAVRRT